MEVHPRILAEVFPPWQGRRQQEGDWWIDGLMECWEASAMPLIH
jgi:hypothetical protein